MPFIPGIPPLAARRVDEIPRGTTMPHGMRRSFCVQCDAALWLTPESRKVVKRGLAQPVCFACLMTLTGGKMPRLVMTEGMAAELDSLNKTNRL